MKYMLLLLVTWSLVSCTVYGVTNDYKKLSAPERERIIPLADFSQTDTLHVYKVNGKQLKQEIEKQPKALVYLFENGCTAQYCLPMAAYERFAKENNYALYLVMDGYGNIDKTLGQRSAVFTAPLYVIDNDFYKSWYSVRYTRLFSNDLRGISAEKKPDWEGSLYFFTNGKLEKVTQTLPF